MDRRTFIASLAASLVPAKKVFAQNLLPSGLAAGPAAAVSGELFSGVEEAVKFKLDDLANIISNRNHEDWWMVAYPDPSFFKTGIADIGAGFNLNAEKKEYGDENDHYQFNNRVRQEPGSQRLWLEAGLAEEHFHAVLERFQERIKKFQKKHQPFKALHDKFRELTADPANHDISEEDARKLLIVSIRHAAHNAMAYARDFPNMTASQQMAMTELVYQMGSNFEGFEKTLAVLNDTSYHDMPAKADQHWKQVQEMLVKSKWFRLYKTRAVEVIARFDPHYDELKPHVAEGHVYELASPGSTRHGIPAGKHQDHLHASRMVRANSAAGPER